MVLEKTDRGQVVIKAQTRPSKRFGMTSSIQSDGFHLILVHVSFRLADSYHIVVYCSRESRRSFGDLADGRTDHQTVTVSLPPG